MRRIILLVALVVAFISPAMTVFANDPGTVAGTDNSYFGPYFEQRLDNHGQ